MNTKSLLHTAAPFLLLAVCFAALMQQTQYGFVQGSEGSVSSALQQMVGGTFPAFPEELGSSLASAPLFVPFYLLWIGATGAPDGFIYFSRLVVTALGFAVALAIFQVGNRAGYRAVALMIALAEMLFSGVGALGIVFRLGIVLLSAAGTLAWCTYRQSLVDDGTATGYARVLVPLFAGVLLVFAIMCSWVIFLPALLVIFTTASRASKRPKGLISFVWVAAGALVAVVILLMYLLGFDNPDTVISSYLTALFSGSGDIFSGSSRFAAPCAACCLFTVALLIGVALAYYNDKLSGKGATVAIVGVLVLCVAAQGFWFASVHLDCDTALEDGPASYLIASEQEAALYVEVKAAAKAVGDEQVEVYSANTWTPLMFENVATAKSDDILWTFVASDIAVDFDESFLDTHAPLVENSAGVLYRKASKQSYIAQG